MDDEVPVAAGVVPAAPAWDVAARADLWVFFLAAPDALAEFAGVGARCCRDDDSPPVLNRFCTTGAAQ
jgi:hypothetical protein